MKKIVLLTLCLSTTLATQAQMLPYQNPQLSAEERAEDLLSRLTLKEKTQLMMNGSQAIPRLGIPAFEWWSEALHGIGRNGVATVFPQCIGMACSFDNALINRIYTAVSDEGRAKNTLARQQGNVGKYRGLSFWTPNINIFRDPRWGRGQETYGEDPFMNARMGLAVVQGLQGVTQLSKEHPYFKLHACAKHFAVHSGPEKTRHYFNIEDLPQRDLWETYLPAFKTLVQEGNVQQVMCAYQRFEGDPCCGSNRLLQQILRDEWGFQGLVVSDCGAISDFWRKHHHEVSKDAAASTAKAILSGTDVECGSTYKSLPEAVQRGDISEEQVNVSVKRLLKGRFELGDFDDNELVEWTKIPMSVVASKEHKQLALQMAREQTVLLKNNGILPLRYAATGSQQRGQTGLQQKGQSQQKGQRLMVMGPNAADSVMLWGIYYGQPSHSVTILEGIEKKIGKVPYTKGCEITDMTEKESLFNLLTDAEGKPGIKAQYWNNVKMEDDVVATANYTSAIALDNGGNTAFAPGVELTNFTTRMNGSFVAERTETLDLLANNDDGLRIIVNGDTIHNRWRSDWPIARTFKLKVEQGKRYDVQLDYMQLDDDATLNFDIVRNRPITTQDMVTRAKDADIVIFVGGISPLLEREEAKVTNPGFDNGDRTSIELPQAQRDILKALHEAGKKIVFVNCSGSAVALTPEQEETCDAIVQAWYPGEQGGHAIADVLFGDYNPSGKLAVTFYKDDTQLPAFDDYHMTNRTYRYFKGEPLYPFGYGLSYTTFDIEKPQYINNKVRVSVKNTGKCDGTEVVQVYIRHTADTEGPLKTLRAYERVNLKAGESKMVEIDFPRDRFEGWDIQTNTMRVVPGKYEMMVGSSSADKDLKKIVVNIK
ncbi:MAG: glycoside hydrolase family 3 C-terminal domain-containing protein [Prevotella sp.]|nr:glycoside hydrolase family 3 C-terminal domain-containing protein [Prevotella sp.]